MTPRHIILPTNRLLILSDLHLDKAQTSAKATFLNSLKKSDFDAALITGDISVAATLTAHLLEILDACGSRPLLITTGNHDYYGSSFIEVDRSILELCSTHRNLTFLGGGEIIEFSKSTALVGHRGWYDGLAGSGVKTRIESPDRYMIEDFRRLGRGDFFRKLQQLGMESADYFRRVLPTALSRYRSVLVSTHVPPFSQGVRYNDKGCVWNRQPFFVNRAAGNLIWGISKAFPHGRIQVCAGHTHSASSVSLRSNLSMCVAAARPGSPQKGELLMIS
jgi:predicted phosphohydrolase